MDAQRRFRFTFFKTQDTLSPHSWVLQEILNDIEFKCANANANAVGMFRKSVPKSISYQIRLGSTEYQIQHKVRSKVLRTRTLLVRRKCTRRAELE